MARVSVIIPTFNRFGLLCRAVESVLQQSYEDVEIIVVDDGSIDDTQTAFPRRFPSIRYVRIGHSGLPAAARNAGIRHAQGEYIAFLDSDDRWMPNKLLQQLEAFRANPAVGLSCSNAFVIHDDSEDLSHHYLQPHQGISGRVLDALVNENFVIASTAVIRRSVLNQVGLFCEERKLRAVEDYDLWLRISTVSEIAYIPSALAVYRDTPSVSIRGSVSWARHLQSRLLIIRRLRQFLTSRTNHDIILENRLKSQELELRKACIKALLSDRRYVGIIPQLMALCVRDPLVMGRAVLRRMKARSQIVLPKGIKFRSYPSPAGISNNCLKLHLGCGEVYLPGYINIDFPPDQHSVQQQSRADIFADLTTLTYSEGTIDEIRLHHVFEHFERSVALRLLIEWYAWLKEGGRLIIETPDFDRCVREYLNGGSVKAKAKMLRHLFGSHEAKWAIHRDGWYHNKFEQILTALGYQDLEFQESEWQGIFNITVTARKRAPWKSPSEQLRTAETLLALSLVNDSPIEQQMLQVWMAQIGNTGAHSDKPHQNIRLT